MQAESYTWHGLFTQPNKEGKAEVILRKRKIDCYLPKFTKQVRSKGRLHRPKNCAVIPGMLFIPVEAMAAKRRTEIFREAAIYGFLRTTGNVPKSIPQRDIEIIKAIETKLNRNTKVIHSDFKPGQKVRFRDQVYSAYLGSAEIFEVLANGKNVGIIVQQLFGRLTRIHVAASDLVAL